MIADEPVSDILNLAEEPEIPFLLANFVIQHLPFTKGGTEGL